MMIGSGSRGRYFGEGPRKIALFFMAVLLGVFFLLVTRLVWDQMHGAPPLKLKGPIHPREFQKEALRRR